MSNRYLEEMLGTVRNSGWPVDRIRSPRRYQGAEKRHNSHRGGIWGKGVS